MVLYLNTDETNKTFNLFISELYAHLVHEETCLISFSAL